MARVASFAPERIIININTPKPNRTNLIHIERLFNKKSRSGLQIPFTASTLPFSQRKLRSVLERAVCHLASCSDNNLVPCMAMKTDDLVTR